MPCKNTLKTSIKNQKKLKLIEKNQECFHSESKQRQSSCLFSKSDRHELRVLKSIWLPWFPTRQTITKMHQGIVEIRSQLLIRINQLNLIKKNPMLTKSCTQRALYRKGAKHVKVSGHLGIKICQSNSTQVSQQTQTEEKTILDDSGVKKYNFPNYELSNCQTTSPTECIEKTSDNHPTAPLHTWGISNDKLDFLPLNRNNSDKISYSDKRNETHIPDWFFRLCDNGLSIALNSSYPEELLDPCDEMKQLSSASRLLHVETLPYTNTGGEVGDADKYFIIKEVVAMNSTSPRKTTDGANLKAELSKSKRGNRAVNNESSQTLSSNDSSVIDAEISKEGKFTRSKDFRSFLNQERQRESNGRPSSQSKEVHEKKPKKTKETAHHENNPKRFKRMGSLAKLPSAKNGGSPFINLGRIRQWRLTNISNAIKRFQAILQRLGRSVQRAKSKPSEHDDDQKTICKDHVKPPTGDKPGKVLDNQRWATASFDECKDLNNSSLNNVSTTCGKCADDKRVISNNEDGHNRLCDMMPVSGNDRSIDLKQPESPIKKQSSYQLKWDQNSNTDPSSRGEDIPESFSDRSPLRKMRLSLQKIIRKEWRSSKTKHDGKSLSEEKYDETIKPSSRVSRMDSGIQNNHYDRVLEDSRKSVNANWGSDMSGKDFANAEFRMDNNILSNVKAQRDYSFEGEEMSNLVKDPISFKNVVSDNHWTYTVSASSKHDINEMNSKPHPWEPFAHSREPKVDSHIGSEYSYFKSNTCDKIDKQTPKDSTVIEENDAESISSNTHLDHVCTDWFDCNKSLADLPCFNSTFEINENASTQPAAMINNSRKSSIIPTESKLSGEPERESPVAYTNKLPVASVMLSNHFNATDEGSASYNRSSMMLNPNVRNRKIGEQEIDCKFYHDFSTSQRPANGGNDASLIHSEPKVVIGPSTPITESFITGKVNHLSAVNIGAIQIPSMTCSASKIDYKDHSTNHLEHNQGSPIGKQSTINHPRNTMPSGRDNCEREERQINVQSEFNTQPIFYGRLSIPDNGSTLDDHRSSFLPGQCETPDQNHSSPNCNPYKTAASVHYRPISSQNLRFTQQSNVTNQGSSQYRRILDDSNTSQSFSKYVGTGITHRDSVYLQQNIRDKLSAKHTHESDTTLNPLQQYDNAVSPATSCEKRVDFGNTHVIPCQNEMAKHGGPRCGKEAPETPVAFGNNAGRISTPAKKEDPQHIKTPLCRQYNNETRHNISSKSQAGFGRGSNTPSYENPGQSSQERIMEFQLQVLSYINRILSTGLMPTNLEPSCYSETHLSPSKGRSVPSSRSCSGWLADNRLLDPSNDCMTPDSLLKYAHRHGAGMEPCPTRNKEICNPCNRSFDPRDHISGQKPPVNQKTKKDRIGTQLHVDDRVFQNSEGGSNKCLEESSQRRPKLRLNEESATSDITWDCENTLTALTKASNNCPCAKEWRNELCAGIKNSRNTIQKPCALHRCEERIHVNKKCQVGGSKVFSKQCAPSKQGGHPSERYDSESRNISCKNPSDEWSTHADQWMQISQDNGTIEVCADPLSVETGGVSIDGRNISESLSIGRWDTPQPMTHHHSMSQPKERFYCDNNARLENYCSGTTSSSSAVGSDYLRNSKRNSKDNSLEQMSNCIGTETNERRQVSTAKTFNKSPMIHIRYRSRKKCDNDNVKPKIDDVDRKAKSKDVSKKLAQVLKRSLDLQQEILRLQENVYTKVEKASNTDPIPRDPCDCEPPETSSQENTNSNAKYTILDTCDRVGSKSVAYDDKEGFLNKVLSNKNTNSCFHDGEEKGSSNEERLHGRMFDGYGLKRNGFRDEQRMNHQCCRLVEAESKMLANHFNGTEFNASNRPRLRYKNNYHTNVNTQHRGNKWDLISRLNMNIQKKGNVTMDQVKNDSRYTDEKANIPKTRVYFPNEKSHPITMNQCGNVKAVKCYNYFSNNFHDPGTSKSYLQSPEHSFAGPPLNVLGNRNFQSSADTRYWLSRWDMNSLGLAKTFLSDNKKMTKSAVLSGTDQCTLKTKRPRSDNPSLHPPQNGNLSRNHTNTTDILGKVKSHSRHRLAAATNRMSNKITSPEKGRKIRVLSKYNSNHDHSPLRQNSDNHPLLSPQVGAWIEKGNNVNENKVFGNKINNLDLHLCRVGLVSSEDGHSDLFDSKSSTHGIDEIPFDTESESHQVRTSHKPFTRNLMGNNAPFDIASEHAESWTSRVENENISRQFRDAGPETTLTLNIGSNSLATEETKRVEEFQIVEKIKHERPLASTLFVESLVLNRKDVEKNLKERRTKCKMLPGRSKISQEIRATQNLGQNEFTAGALNTGIPLKKGVNEKTKKNYTGPNPFEITNDSGCGRMKLVNASTSPAPGAIKNQLCKGPSPSSNIRFLPKLKNGNELQNAIIQWWNCQKSDAIDLAKLNDRGKIDEVKSLVKIRQHLGHDVLEPDLDPSSTYSNSGDPDSINDCGRVTSPKKGIKGRERIQRPSSTDQNQEIVAAEDSQPGKSTSRMLKSITHHLDTNQTSSANSSSESYEKLVMCQSKINSDLRKRSSPFPPDSIPDKGPFHLKGDFDLRRKEVPLVTVAQVVEADEERVILGGIFYKRDSNNFSNLSSDKNTRDIMSFRLIIINDGTDSNQSQVLRGSYRRQMMTSEKYFKWHFNTYSLRNHHGRPDQNGS